MFGLITCVCHPVPFAVGPAVLRPSLPCRHELEECEKLCETALTVSDGKRDEASMILAEVIQ